MRVVLDTNVLLYDVTQKRQCVLAGVSRTTLYLKRKPLVIVESDEVLKRLIDGEYTRHPF